MKNFYIHFEENNVDLITKQNFGDAVNRKFWETFIGEKIIANREDDHYITTGSIMAYCNDKSIVFGSGFLTATDNVGNEWDFSKSEVYPKEVIAVRGPLTRDRLLAKGISCPEVYGDPLIMFPAIYNVKKQQKKNLIGILPHYWDEYIKSNNIQLLKTNLEENGYKVNILSMAVGDNYENLINDISECDYVITSALHGLILSLAYKVKTILVDFSEDRLNNLGRKFKYDDFLQSIDLDYEIKNVFDFTVLSNTLKINNEKVKFLGLNLIQHCPFISNERKNILSKKYLEFYELEKTNY